MKSVNIDENHSIVINKNNIMLLYVYSTNKFYPFESKEDIPVSVADEYSVKHFNNAIKRFHQKDFDEFVLDERTINSMNKIKSRPKLHYNPSGKAMNFMLDKKVYEDFFNIFVNADNINEKYYLSPSKRYEQLTEFELGCMIEDNFTVLTDEGVEVSLCLSDSELHTLYAMFRRKKKPDHDCIRFNNMVLDTDSFEETNSNVFTVKNVYFDYKNLDDCEEDTLVERTLRQIFINKQGGSEIYFNDFLERLGACFLRQNKHKFIYMLWGSGDDGKSIILYIISLIFKNLGVWTAIDSYTDKFFKVNLGDTQVLLTDELNKNSFSREVTAVLKDITGRGATDSRVMHSQSTVKVKDYGVPFMATNIVPNVPFDDTAYWNRLHLVRLPNKFVTVENGGDLGDNEYLKDEELEEKLAADTDGIEWLISASINAYCSCAGRFSVKQSITDTQFIYDGDNPIRLFIERFVVETQDIIDVLSNLEIKYYLLKFCIKNNVDKNSLEVNSSRELSQVIGYKLKNKFKNIETAHRNIGKVYLGLCLNVDDREVYEVDELKHEISYLEDYIFS